MAYLSFGWSTKEHLSTDDDVHMLTSLLLDKYCSSHNGQLGWMLDVHISSLRVDG